MNYEPTVYIYIYIYWSMYWKSGSLSHYHDFHEILTEHVHLCNHDDVC